MMGDVCNEQRLEAIITKLEEQVAILKAQIVEYRAGMERLRDMLVNP